MNKITRKSFLKVLAATMVGGAAASALTGAAAPVSIDETNGKVSRWVKNNLNPDGPLTIAKQGMFSSGGTVTAPVAGTYDATTNWLDTTRAGNTAHVDHANVLYQIPADSNGCLESCIVLGLITLLAIYRHKQNIVRLIKGTENKFSLKGRNKTTEEQA